MHGSSRIIKVGIISFLFLVAALCYSLGVSGSFLLDDFTNFERLNFADGSVNGYLRAIFSNNGDILNRPISYASFLLNLGDWPDNPAGFKWFNTVLHLICGTLLFYCIKLAPYRDENSKYIFTIFLLGFWLLCPLSVSTVLYAVQRMTILSCLFGLAAIVFYLKARLNIDKKVGFLYLFLTAFFVVLSFLSKENGILLIPLIALVHWYLKDEKKISQPPRWLDFLVLLGVIIFSLLLVYLFYKYVFFGFGARSFTVWERLMLQGKILADYIYLLILPNISYMSLHHDGYEYFTNGTLVAGCIFWVFHIIAIGLSIKFWKKNKLIAFGVLWFYVGHLIESTFVALELMFEHRNYLPSIGIYILPSALIAKYSSRLNFKTTWMKPLVLSVPLLLFSVLLAYRSALWSDHTSLTIKWAAFKKNSPRAQYIFTAELDKAGFKSMAYGKMRESALKFNRLGFYLYTWTLQCGLEGDLSDDELIEFPSVENIEGMYHTSEISLELEKLLNLWSEGKCIPQGYTYTSVDEFLDAVLNIKLLNNKQAYKAQILVAIGNFYTKQGNFNKTSEAWRELYKTQPSMDNAFRNIDFALKFGLYDYAEEYLKKAWEQNNKMSTLAADRSSLVEKYAQKIEESRRSQNTSSQELEVLP